jgi:hypothetical protein
MTAPVFVDARVFVYPGTFPPDRRYSGLEMRAS